MIKLVNLSKYYQSENNVALGLSKINLELKMGEFVAITGESGSGKSTLLNVISGMDSYEDGEMYFNNEETSYYDKTDWENYRRENIAFVFQNYGLIDSYTVYENVISAMVINNQVDVEKKALAIIEKVGLTSHIKHKGTKLSGGQKQRLAIARALAKECNVLVADEPTGNLDSKTGSEIIALLKEISKEKLVIVVTHNFDEVKDLATRKIRVFDAKIVEDISLQEYTEVEVKEKEVVKNNLFKNSLFFSKLNILSQPRRTLFTFIVTIFMSILVGLVLCNFTYFQSSDTVNDVYNKYFNYLDQERIIVRKDDLSTITEDDYNKLSNIKNIDFIYKNDIVLDLYFSTSFSSSYFNVRPIETIEGDLLYGELPVNDNEVVISMPNYLIEDDKLINEEIILSSINNDSYIKTKINCEVVGVIGTNSYERIIYGSENLFDDILLSNFLDGEFIELSLDSVSTTFKLNYLGKPSNYTNEDNVIYLPTSIYTNFKDNDYIDFTFDNNSFNLKIVESSDNESFYLSENIIDEIYKEESQYSIFINDYNNLESVKKELEKLGYIYISPYESSILSNDFILVIRKVGMMILSIIFIVCIYFLGYLVLKLIFSQKKKDFGILKSIGMDKKTILNINIIELSIYFIISFLFALITIEFLSIFITFLTNFHWYHYGYLLVINLLIGLFVALMFNRSISKKSVMQTIKEK